MSKALFSGDCNTLILSGEPGIQPPASYIRSTGLIPTLCPESVRGDDSGFVCALNNNPTPHFIPNTYGAHWTVEDDRGNVSSAPPYFFQTLLKHTAPLFPMERVVPSAVLGRDNMVGRQALTPQTLGSHHPLGNCWGGTTLRGSIATGYGQTCVLQGDGGVRCWGSNDTGQSNVSPGLRAVALAAGNGYSCALQAEGAVRCWGGNGQGQLNVPEDLARVAAIAAGASHVCALQTDGKVRCWGGNNSGQSQAPTWYNTLALAAGSEHTCALRDDGRVHCWGGNEHGQTAVPWDLSAVVALAAGASHTCALQLDGTVRCWGATGYANYGQTEVPGDLGEVVALAAGGYNTCALQDDGRVRCWGSTSNNVTDVPEDLSAVAISVGSSDACALEARGRVRCWGRYSSFGYAQRELEVAVQTLGQLVIQP